ncbi:Scavenger receptor class B member 1 [Eumeta japonica]|uniref:Scavenger receptor class B member 1 n=1 Tax=Eumeta variegata TaxID=151549 RepID=A0A4C1WJL5_EUMVA|nr:Scavenger receptor class B member 1 [Eumeta japonica]
MIHEKGYSIPDEYRQILILTLSFAPDSSKSEPSPYTTLRDDSFIFHMWEKPTYQLYSDVWVYNYTNVPEFLAGEESVLKLEEIGPFTFIEERLNLNLTIDKERGVARMRPKTSLHFLPEQSIGHYKDINVTVPNLAVLAISTLLADELGYFANAGAYMSMNAMGSKLFRNMTVEEYLWGYYDPIVKFANTLLPGWIDFAEIGILDRFYADKNSHIEVMLKDKDSRYSIISWDDSPGLKEQGYRDWNTSVPCNRIRGAYEGLMLSPGFSKDRELPIFRKQGCRVYPFSFESEKIGDYGLNEYRFSLQQSAFNRSSRYACACDSQCLPDGFVDIGGCYYGFPIALSKPHFLDVDPAQKANFEGMHPDPEKHSSHLNVEPTYGIPLSLVSNIQANIAVRTSPYNPITKPLNDKIMPLVWLSLYCKSPPPEIIDILRLRFVIAPPLIITVEVLLFLAGFLLGVQGFYRLFKGQRTEVKKRPRSVITILENKTFKAHSEHSKEVASLLAVNDEDLELPDIITTNDGYDSRIERNSN